MAYHGTLKEILAIHFDDGNFHPLLEKGIKLTYYRMYKTQISDTFKEILMNLFIYLNIISVFNKLSVNYDYCAIIYNSNKLGLSVLNNVKTLDIASNKYHISISDDMIVDNWDVLLNYKVYSPCKDKTLILSAILIGMFREDGIYGELFRDWYLSGVKVPNHTKLRR